jgi:uncharacterized membrane protein
VPVEDRHGADVSGRANPNRRVASIRHRDRNAIVWLTAAHISRWPRRTTSAHSRAGSAANGRRGSHRPASARKLLWDLRANTMLGAAKADGVGSNPVARADLPWLTRLARALVLASLEAASAGLAAWAFASRNIMPAYVRHNDLCRAGRRYAFIDMGVGVAIAAAVVAALFVWNRRLALGRVERLARLASPVFLAGLVPILFDHRLWDGRDSVVLPLVVIFSWGLYASVVVAWRTGTAWPALYPIRIAVRLRERPRAHPGAIGTRVDPALLVVIAGACAYAVYFSIVTIVNHRNLGTSSFDLGLEENLIWHVVHGGPLFRSTPFSGPTGTHFGNHATFFAFLIAPLYWLSPHPETLLVIQATLLGAAAIPLYLYARRHVSATIAAVVAFSYLVYPPLHGANLYDFHYLPLGVFFLWLTLYAAESRKLALTATAAVLALSTREDVAACLCVVGVFLLLSGAAARIGAVLAALAGTYFITMKLGIMPRFAGGGESFISQYKGLQPPDEHGFGGVLKTIIANPAFTANVVFEGDKLIYVFQLMAPILFLPLIRPVGFLLVLPGIVFTLMSTGYWPLYQPCFQYTSYWIAFEFIGVVLALEHAGHARYDGDRVGPARQRALTMALVAASLTCTYLDGAVLNQNNVRGGFGRINLLTTDADLRNRADLASLIGQIPADGKVVASEHLVPHVAGRSDVYTLRYGTFDADWLLFQMPIGGDERARARSLLEDGHFGIVDDRGEMVLAQRGHSPVENVAVLERMGN